ncbi:gluconokinase [Microbacterium sp. W1N]|uniref:gluconokinase n=1 Tax=Microbacterium festucae TaxID=2977531 RepID=UPI0021C02AD6|nr:gluconokinase [Microbacterium festucae]MCT9821370.1 gluconokinase [Microbacterium festucae]
MTPSPVVVMGVSASGKSSVAIELAALRGVAFVDADDLHPAANVAKMTAGMALDDADRWPWLDAVGGVLSSSTGVVVACSALKRAYRDRLRAMAPGVLFVHLHGAHELLATRAAARSGHFMPPQLLRSQLVTLEPLEGDEAGMELDVDAPVTVIARTALEWWEAHER